MVLHDLNHAARFAGRVVVLRSGRVVADGTPGDVLTVAMCREVFGVHVSVVTDPVTGAPVCLPYDTVTLGHESSRGWC